MSVSEVVVGENDAEFWILFFFAFVILMQFVGVGGNTVSENAFISGISPLMLIPVGLVQAIAFTAPLLTPLAVACMVLYLFGAYKQFFGQTFYMVVIGAAVVALTGA